MALSGPVQFGVLVMPQQPVTDPPVQRFRDCVPQRIVARNVGFNSISAGYHYASLACQSLQNVLFLARLPTDTGAVRICTSAVVLALGDPGSDRRGDREPSRDVRGAGDPRSRLLRDRLPEVRGLPEERVGAHGRGARAEQAALDRGRGEVRGHILSGDQGDGRLSTRPEAVSAHLDRGQRRRGRRADRPPRLPVVRQSACAAGDGRAALWPHKAALATARPFLAKKYQAYADWGQDEALPGEEPGRVGCDELSRDRFTLGSPEDAIEQLERRVEQLEANYFMFRVGWPGMENYKVLRALELMGEDVQPHCHKKYGRVIR